MNRAYLLLGSNLMEREKFIAEAKKLIGNDIGPIFTSSSVYESESWGFISDQKFLNQVIIVDTKLNPEQLLKAIFKIENKLGRKRIKDIGYASRTIDIDILFYNEMVINLKNLRIPHPRLHERLFTLIPLGELDENFLHPGLKKTIKQLTEDCKDGNRVSLFQGKQNLMEK